MNFIFFVYLIGLVITVFQDFKRREIDNWLNLFLFFSGLLSVLLFEEYSIANLGVFIFISAGISFLFCFLRVFSGGDSKLLFALSPYFYSLTFSSAAFNLGIFILLLLISGSVYGLLYASFLFFGNFRETKKEFVGQIKKRYFLILLAVAVITLVFGLFYFIFIYLALFMVFIVLLFCVTLSLEKNVLVFKLSTKNIAEGDMLVKDLKIGRKLFVAGERLSEEDSLFLNKRDLKVFIKDGVPYAFSFLVAFILYYFRDSLLFLLFQLKV